MSRSFMVAVVVFNKNPTNCSSNHKNSAAVNSSDIPPTTEMKLGGKNLKSARPKGNEAVGRTGWGGCCHENTRVWGGWGLPTFIRWNSRRALCGYSKD